MNINFGTRLDVVLYILMLLFFQGPRRAAEAYQRAAKWCVPDVQPRLSPVFS